MNIQEIKKLFDLKRILLIVIFGILFYALFFRQYRISPIFNSEKVLLDFSIELKEKYGNSIDDNEYIALLQAIEEQEESKIDIWIKENQEFRDHQIYNYKDFFAIIDTLPDSVAGPLYSRILTGFTEEEQNEGMKIVLKKEYLESLTDYYNKEVKSGKLTAFYPQISEQFKSRMEERKPEEVHSFMPKNIMRRYLGMLPDFSIFLLLSMILLVVPYSVKDTMEGINTMQYTAKKGCRYYWIKALSVLSGTLILGGIEILLFMFMIGRNGAFHFMDCYVSGFANPFISFVKLTFGQYIGISIIYILIVGLCLALLTYCLSGMARNYISAIAFQIPFIIFSMVLSLGLMPHFAEITQNITLLISIPVLCMMIAVCGNIIRFISLRTIYMH